MATPRTKLISLAAAIALVGGDSGSMNWEILSANKNGELIWGRDSQNGSGNVWGFFENNGSLRNGGSNLTDEYVELFNFPGRGTARRTVPPTKYFGFARSHEFNPAYFDPSVLYSPWIKGDGSSWANANPLTAYVDPRNTSSQAFNLTADVTRDGDNDWEFDFQQGMVIPQGTYYYDDCNNLPGNNSGWKTANSDITFDGACTTGIRYFPATYYLSTPTSPDGYTATPLAVANAPGGPRSTTLYRYEIKPANYANPLNYTKAIQNFANWFSYYRDRNLSMVAGMTHSLADVNNMRVGYFTINNYNARDEPLTKAGERVSMFDMAVPADRASLYTEMTGLPASGSTYNRQAVAAGSSQFQRTDANAPVKLACQKNALMLFTDGYSNQNSVSVGNIDGNMGAPYSDGYSNTMADIASRYYLDTAVGGVAPLRTGAGFPAGQVPVPEACDAPSPDPKLDCQRNLHVNFYGVTLGARGDIYDPNNVRDPYQAPYPAWPGVENDNPSTVDDIWHATVNTRGDFIVATTPADITAAMRRILASVSAGDSPSGSVAITGSRIGPSSLSVIPEYQVENEGTDWSSVLNAYTLAVSPTNRAVEPTLYWEASSRMPVWNLRNVFFGSGSNVLPFTAANVTLGALCTKPAQYNGISRCTGTDLANSLGATPANAVRYLLGEATHEVANKAAAPAGAVTFRARERRLGDIVNSSPVVSSPLDDYGYSSLGGTLGSTYSTYMQQKTSLGRPFMVYVGANDGMLHGFNGGMNADLSNNGLGGREEFGYVPTTALGHMGNLLWPYDSRDQNDQKFVHKYFVDGPITVTDTNYGNAWHTSLVGTAGAGGRSVFALDVSNPTSFSATNRLWEISDLNTALTAPVRNNIGFVLGKPVIVPLKTNGGGTRFVTIFGNGYNSASGKAVLFIVDIATGAPTIKMIEAVETGATVPAGPNGLGNVVVVDRWADATDGTLTRRGSDGFADTAYGADQKGAIWKFDLRSATPANLTTPMFVTRSFVEGGQNYRQPIIGGMTATAGLSGGINLYFGTGSFSFNEDPQDTSVQTLYSVNDTSVGPVATTLSRTNLHAGSVVTIAGSTTTRGVQFTATPPVGSKGWYVDLPAGERFVATPRVVSGVVFLPTYDPSTSSNDCSTDGFNWLYGLDARTGAAGLFNARVGSPDGSTTGTGVAGVSLNTGGNAPVKEVGVTVLPRLQPPAPGGPGGPAPPPDYACWMRVSTAGLTDALYLPYPCGRQSWRQIE